jgi:hypothetical protein
MFDHRDSLGQAKTNSDKGNASRKAHFTCDGVVDRHIKIWPSDVLSVPGPVEAQNFLNPEKKAAPTPSQIRGTGIAVKTFRFKIPCIGWHIASAANAPSPSARVDRNSQGRGHTRMRWGLAPTITPMQSLDRLHWHDRRYAKPARPSVPSDRRHRSRSRDIDADPVSAEGLPGRRSRLSEAQFRLARRSCAFEQPEHRSSQGAKPSTISLCAHEAALGRRRACSRKGGADDHMSRARPRLRRLPSNAPFHNPPRTKRRQARVRSRSGRAAG